MIALQKFILPDGKYLTYTSLKQKKESSAQIVYLCGFGSDSTSSKAVGLSKFCEKEGLGYFCLEYFGHGSSYGNFVDHCLSDWIENTITAIDKLTEGPLIVVGSSMGGFIMLHLALQRPERITAMVALAPAPDFTHRLVLASLSPEHLEVLNNTGIIEEIHESGSQYIITKKLIDDGANHLLMDRDIININIPTRIIHGMQDIDVPYSLSLELAGKLATNDLQITLIKDAEHRLSRAQDIDIIIQIISDLIK